MSDWFHRFGFAEVADGLLIGAFPTDAEDVQQLADAGVRAVFNLCEDAEYDDGAREEAVAALQDHGIIEERLSCVDYGNLPPDALDQASRTVLAWLERDEIVYLHCRAGWQRSATVATAIVALREGVALDVALDSIRHRKPSAQPLAHQLEDLIRWWKARSVREGA